MKRKRYRLRLESFRMSVIVHYLLLVVVPFLLLLTVFFLYTYVAAANTYAANALKLIQAEQRQLAGVSRTCMQNSMFPYYQQYLSGLPGVMKDPVKREEIRTWLTHEISIRQNIDAILLHADDQWITVGRNYNGVTQWLPQYDDLLKESCGRPLWLTSFAALPRNRSGYKLVLGRSLNDVGRQDVAKLYLLIDADVFDPIFDGEGAGGGTWLLNPDGLVLAAAEKETIGSIMDASALGLTGREGWRIMTISGERCLVVYALSARTGWMLVRAVPMTVVRQGLEIVHWVALLVGVIYTAFLWLMLGRLDYLIFRPAEQLAAHMDSVAAGDLTIRAQDDGKGEIGRLNRHFNQMTERIARLIQKNEETEREKNDLRMTALVAQLSPHFLYNALNTIKWMAVMNRQSNIQEMTESLIRILMNAAHAGPDFYSLRDEIRLIQDYGVIQKARFMNFCLETHITKEAADCSLRRFLVQPVVENAIIHGFGRGQQSNGVIDIHAWTDENLHIRVTDNGCGFDPSSLMAGDDPGHSQEHVSLAIHHIRQIIALEYGEPYAMQIESAPGEGTRVEYVLPIIHSQRGDIEEEP